MARPPERGLDFVKILVDDDEVGRIEIGRTGDTIGFYGAAAIAKPASGNQAAVGAMTTVGANTGTAGAGLSLIGNTTSVDQAANIMNDFRALQEDVTALQVLVNRLRTDLVSLGLIKGSA